MHFKEARFAASEVVLNYAEGRDTGPPFVVLHGGSGRWQYSHEFLGFLAAEFHVFAPDFRGHGNSGRAQTGYQLADYVRDTTVDGEPLKNDPVVRQRIAQLVTEGEVARVLGLRVVDASEKSERHGAPPPTVEASVYKLYATEFSRRLADASMDIGGPGAQVRVRTDEAPMRGRAESTYRYTVIDTIGGGTSEVQKNIIARRALGLPKNF